MPNDAKLGLLVGVVGVIAVAVMSAKRPQPQETATTPPPAESAPQPRAVAKRVVPPTSATEPQPVRHVETAPAPHALPVPSALPTELRSTPVVRTKREPVATPTSRTRDEDVEP
ncbi:MAG: hypothetical protein U0792_21625 [Gemmataceae bacterium]